jgi:hypothetical protein
MAADDHVTIIDDQDFRVRRAIFFVEHHSHAQLGESLRWFHVFGIWCAGAPIKTTVKHHAHINAALNRIAKCTKYMIDRTVFIDADHIDRDGYTMLCSRDQTQGGGVVVFNPWATMTAQ